MKQRAAKALNDFDAGLADDLNTAVALAATFDFVREANIAMDTGSFGQEDVAAAQEFLAAFEQIFAVVKDNDAEKLKELGFGAAQEEASDAWVEARLAEGRSPQEHLNATGPVTCCARQNGEKNDYGY